MKWFSSFGLRFFFFSQKKKRCNFEPATYWYLPFVKKDLIPILAKSLFTKTEASTSSSTAQKGNFEEGWCSEPVALSWLSHEPINMILFDYNRIIFCFKVNGRKAH